MCHKLTNLKWTAIMAIFITLDYAKFTIAKEIACYLPVFLDSGWTDHRPDFMVNMTFSDAGFIYSETTVAREIQNPISQFRIVQKDGIKRPSTLYNITTRLCDIDAMFNKVPVMKQAYLAATKQSNMSMECPLKPGFYVMGNMRIGGRNPIMSIVYRPRVRYTITGGVYDELQNKTLLPLTTYNFTMKIVKKLCKE